MRKIITIMTAKSTSTSLSSLELSNCGARDDYKDYENLHDDAWSCNPTPRYIYDLEFWCFYDVFNPPMWYGVFCTRSRVLILWCFSLHLCADHPGGRFSPPEEHDMAALNLKQTKSDIWLLRNLAKKTYSKQLCTLDNVHTQNTHLM